MIGAERERKREDGEAHFVAGIRTFAVTSLLGAVSWTLGGVPLTAVTLGAITAYAAVAYFRTHEHDPGLTTEVSLLLTVMLGALAMREPPVASGLAVVLAVLLAARAPLHRFVRSVLSDEEIRDGLILAAATLVVLPLTPNEAMGPHMAINPRRIWTIVVLVMAVSAAGYIAVRLLGPRYGLPVAGFASGFVSSSATIAAMAARSKEEPGLLRPAVAGAALSSVATVVQMAMLLAAISAPVLRAMAGPLAAAGVAALLYGALFTWRSARSDEGDGRQRGHPFSLKAALLFAGAIAFVLVAAAALNDRFGRAGALIAAAFAGFADAHSPAVSVASLAESGKLALADSAVPILAALSTNAVTKAALALYGSRSYAAQVIPGLVLMIGAAWLAYFLG